MVKCLIRKKEIKIQQESIAMALTGVDTFIKPDETLEKKKDKKSKEVRWVIHGMGMSCSADWLIPLCVLCGVTLMCHVWCGICVSRVLWHVCHVWCGTCLSRVVWHWYVTCGVTLVCHVWCGTYVSRVVWQWCVTCGLTIVCHVYMTLVSRVM